MSGQDYTQMPNARTALFDAMDRGDSSRLQARLGKPLLIFILFAAILTLVGVAIFQSYKKGITSDSQHDLAGIAELKTRQITSWMKEGKDNAQALIDDPMFLDEVDRWLQRGGPAGPARMHLAAHLAVPQRAYAAYGYTSVSLFDRHAVLRLSSSPHEEPLRGHDKTQLLASMRSGQAMFSDIHIRKLGGTEQAVIELRAPLVLKRDGKSRTIGAILFRIDPYRFIFPLIQHWPTPSASAESLLVRRDGNEVVFMNELRHIRNQPLAMHFSLDKRRLLATQAVMGKVGLTAGVDYRGVPVVGVLSKVPGTSWFMVSKIDKAEIYAPVDRLARWMLLLMLALAGVGGLLAMFWRKQEIRQYMGELERQALSRHLDYLGKYANDIIMLLDDEGQIVDCNDRAAEAFGYSREELMCLDIDDLRAIDFSMSPVERFKLVDEAGGALLFDSMLVRRNGEAFPVEASARRIEIAGQRYYQTILRDITERRKIEETLRFHSEILKNLSQGIVLVSAGDGMIVFTNAQFDQMFGYEAGELAGKYVSVLNAPGEQSPDAVAEKINAELAGKGVWIGELRNIRKDGTLIWCHARVSEIVHPQFGRVWVSLQEDITESRERDRRLAENVAHVRELSHKLVNLKEEEMRRISGELHDRCSPNLSALKIYFSLLRNSLPAQVDQETAQLLENISAILSDTTDAIREVCADLRPAVLDYAGLWPAIEAVTRNFRQRTGIEIELENSAGELRFAQNIEIRLFRLVQEALTNCAKHSGAQTVHISLSRRGDSTLLKICDDGVGFDPDELGKNGGGVGLGLITMREGIEFAGGKFRLDTALGKGTCIEVELPVSAD